MDFSKFQDILLDNTTSNSTLTSLPSFFLEALIPGYGVISQIIFRLLGFDIGLVVSGCLVIYGLSIGARMLYHKAYSLLSSYFMSVVEIDDDDPLFDQIMDWIAGQRMTKKSRGLKAVTKYDDESKDQQNNDDVFDESGIFNYEKYARTIPPQYEPNFGNDWFSFDSRLFFFTRGRRDNQPVSFYGRGGERQFLSVSCAGRSTEPIKELLVYIKKWHLSKNSKMTTIYRPAPKELGGGGSWDDQSIRPSRPMSTVSLDMEQKVNIARDINEYLRPETARWYAARGVPYRRGYLFHGPPGTGKTSLSFSLAGIFGLDIYCISLMQAGLTESDLGRLFAELPRRCIVLLEDIDSAGLRRPDEPTANNGEDTPSDDGDLTQISKADALPKVLNMHLNTNSGHGTKSLISLSGLLNTIDGVASHEGRVLIMTTNRISTLDSALIRPGRVDLQVEFTLATHDQIRDIFTRMYSTTCDNDVESAVLSSLSPSSSSASPSPSAKQDTSTTTTTTTTPTSPSKPTPETSKSANSPTLQPKSKTKTKTSSQESAFLALISQKPSIQFVEPERLDDMADEFAVKVPAGMFSPAEIQGFLLTRKQEPERALREVDGWRDGVLEGRARGERA